MSKPPTLAEIVKAICKVEWFRPILLEAAKDLLFNFATYSDNETLSRALRGILDSLKLFGEPPDDDSPFTVWLADAVDTRRIISRLQEIFYAEPYQHGVYAKLNSRLQANRERWKDHPSERDFTPGQLVNGYLADTPFQKLMFTGVPFALSMNQRMNHVMVCGGPGAGKTSLIEEFFLHDIRGGASIVIIDPHSDLIQRIVKSDLGIEDRLIYINPKDAPALNVFAFNKERLAVYDEHAADQVRATAIETFNYLFAGLAGDSGGLTTKQQILFSYTAELLLSFPETKGRNATLVDMLDFLQRPDEFTDVIEKLSPEARTFLERNVLDTKNTTFKGTREEVGYRLDGIMGLPAMRKLFSSEETKVDLYQALNNGSIVVVDTNKALLRGGSAIFGRFMITLILQAIMERAARPGEPRKDVILIVDEASDFFSESMDDLLTEVRKYRCSCTFAFQFLSQASGKLRSSLLGATGTKFVCWPEVGEAGGLAASMRTNKELLLDRPALSFATHIRGKTDGIVSIPVRPGLIENGPQLSEERYQEFLAKNRERVSRRKPEPVKTAFRHESALLITHQAEDDDDEGF